MHGRKERSSFEIGENWESNEVVSGSSFSPDRVNFDCHAFKLHLWTTNDAWTIGFSSILVSCFFVFSLIRGLKVFYSDSWFFEGEGFWAGFKVDLVIDGVSWKWDVCFRFYYRVSRDGYIWNFETIDFSLKFLLSLFFFLIKFENFAKFNLFIIFFWKISSFRFISFNDFRLYFA